MLPAALKLLLCGVAAGDFRQTLPIDEKASRAQIVNSLLHQSALWTHVHVCELTENMRALSLMASAVNDAERARIREWAAWLCRLGDGRLVDEDGCIALIRSQLRCLASEADLDQMLRHVYDRVAGMDDYDYWAHRAVVAARHRTVDRLNMLMLARLPGEEVVCYSQDVQDNDNIALAVPEEFLHRQQPAGLPPHELRLKVGAVVMLLRNLKRDAGLVNGTRLIIEQIRCRHEAPRLLVCRILTGEFRGKRVLIPRILLRANPRKYPFPWVRRQFPIKLAYAMYNACTSNALAVCDAADACCPSVGRTINKCQGQTLKFIAVVLAEPVYNSDGCMVRVEAQPCFAHGQLTVALTRVGHPDCVVVYVDPATYASGRSPFVVYPEALLGFEARLAGSGAPVAHHVAHPRPTFGAVFGDGLMEATNWSAILNQAGRLVRAGRRNTAVAFVLQHRAPRWNTAEAVHWHTLVTGRPTFPDEAAYYEQVAAAQLHATDMWAGDGPVSAEHFYSHGPDTREHEAFSDWARFVGGRSSIPPASSVETAGYAGPPMDYLPAELCFGDDDMAMFAANEEQWRALTSLTVPELPSAPIVGDAAFDEQDAASALDYLEMLDVQQEQSLLSDSENARMLVADDELAEDDAFSCLDDEDVCALLAEQAPYVDGFHLQMNHDSSRSMDEEFSDDGCWLQSDCAFQNVPSFSGTDDAAWRPPEILMPMDSFAWHGDYERDSSFSPSTVPDNFFA